MRTGLIAFKLGIAGFIIPFLFVYYPGMLIVGCSAFEVIHALLVAGSSVFLIAAAFEGWVGIHLPVWLRLLMFALGCITLIPWAVADIVGILGAIVIFAFLLYKHTKQKAVA